MNEELVKYAKRQSRTSNIILGFVIGIFLVFAVSAAFIVPKTMKVLGKADEAIENLAEVTDQLSEADLPGLVENVNSLVEDSSEGVLSALDQLNSIDINTLNNAISDLQSVISPLANLFGKR